MRRGELELSFQLALLELVRGQYSTTAPAILVVVGWERALPPAVRHSWFQFQYTLYARTFSVSERRHLKQECDTPFCFVPRIIL